MRRHPYVVLINYTDTPDEECIAVAHALEVQARYHFSPHWNASATVEYFGKLSTGANVNGLIPPHSWPMFLMDEKDNDVAGALGYHDLTADGTPVAKVFLNDGYSWSATASHELLEYLADPYLSLGYQVTNTQWYATEVCDPVEADVFGYVYRGVKLSNFVTPRWFIKGMNGPYDYKGAVDEPLKVLDGGYQYIYENGQWNAYQKQAGNLVHTALENSPRFRSRV